MTSRRTLPADARCCLREPTLNVHPCRYDRTSHDKRTAVEVLTDTIVTVKHKGVVIWSSPALFKSSCRLEVQNYPFDVQQCMLKFGSWSHQGSELELVTEQYQASRLLYDNNPNVEWNLLGVPCKKYPKRFPCCKDTFDYIVYFVTMQRRPLYYLYHLAFPIAQLMAMGAFVFLMPPESGAKVSLSINIVLAMVVFIHVLMDSIPPTSEIISLFAKYICGVTMLLSLTTYVSVIVMHVHFKGTHGRRPPVWLKKLLFYHVAVPLGMANNNCCEVFCGCRANLRRQSSVNQAGYFEDQEFLDNESAISVGVSMADIDGQFYDEYGLLEGEQAPDHSAAIKLGTGGASNESLTTESIHNSSVSAHNSSDNSRLSRSRDSTRNENRIDGFSQDPCASQSDFLKPPDQLSLKDQVSVNIIDVLVDILEELRLVHTIQSDIQLDSDSSEFVKAEWHKVAAIIDRGCLFLYTLSCLLLCGVLWYSVGSNPELASVRLPDDI
ncbi:hypothetical protein LSAT2_026536 [Lamellibrachia satsuma]|nr:hypothetical protein LSAT2_026536 [Lamellibrachia satsuma]